MSVNDILSVLHFDGNSDLREVLRLQTQRAENASRCNEALRQTFGPEAPTSSGVDSKGRKVVVPAAAAAVLELEGVTPDTAPVYVQVLKELRAVQPRESGQWTFEEFLKLL